MLIILLLATSTSIERFINGVYSRLYLLSPPLRIGIEAKIRRKQFILMTKFNRSKNKRKKIYTKIKFIY